MTTSIRTKQCTCGSTVYLKTVDLDNDCAPIWECTNCMATTPRIKRNRRTNRAIAFELWESLLNDSKPLQDALMNSGKYYSFWYHMDALTDRNVKLTKWDTNYHVGNARNILDKLTT